jgi:UDP-2,3-diacylglucosamine hydrolase
MSILAVSDLHIWGNEDPLYQSLITLLREKAAPGDTVVLAGDLFDLFVGNKSIFLKQYSQFIETLIQASNRGVTIHYIEGNHDFLIGNAFQKAKGIKVHADQVSIALEGKKFYFAHGDLVDPYDYGYRLMRAFFRSRAMKLIVKLIPGKFLEHIGKSSSQLSRAGHAELPHKKIEPLRRQFRNYAAEQLANGYDFVVLGHCHDLDEMSFKIGGRNAQYVNIGFPRVHGSFVSWSPGEDKIQRERMP